MNKSANRDPRGRPADTEDRVAEAIGTASAWIDRNRRLATLGLVALVAAMAAGYIYLNYRRDLQERAAVRLDEIRMQSRGAAPAQMRSQLATYIEQFGSTRQANEARLILAEMELDQDSIARAVELLGPVTDLDDHPIGYNAGWVMAVAQEQLGDTEAAARWYDRLADAARHDYQRRQARAARARLYEYAGDYAAAEEIMTELAAEDDASDDADFFGMQLGEVKARAETNAPPPGLPETVQPTESTPTTGDTTRADTASEGAESP